MLSNRWSILLLSGLFRSRDCAVGLTMETPSYLASLRSSVRDQRDASGDHAVASPAKAGEASSFFGELKRHVRWSEWALSRIPMLCTVGSYLALVRSDRSTKFFADFLLFTFVFASANSAFGFLINDLGDRELDRRHGKRNTFLELGIVKGTGLLTALALVMVLSGLPFVHRPGFAFLWALWALSTIAYSLPPLRLKERGARGIVISSIAQWTLPVMIVFAAFQEGTHWELWIFIAATMLSGITLELAHQRHDRPNDATTETSTLAVNLGQRKIDKLYTWALWADRVAVGVVLAVVVLRPEVLELKVSATTLLAGSLIFIYVIALSSLSLRLMNGYAIDPYYGQRTITDRIVHDILPNLLIPGYLLTQLTLQSPIWLGALLFFLIWRVLLPRLN